MNLEKKREDQKNQKQLRNKVKQIILVRKKGKQEVMEPNNGKKSKNKARSK
jgi:hypothetical protein